VSRKALYEKTFNKEPKFPVRYRNRCRLCGRPRAFIRKFALALLPRLAWRHLPA
jgi:small subunit ribosomal protein S14